MCDLSGEGATRIPDFRPILTIDARMVDGMSALPFPERLGVAGLTLRRIARSGEAWYRILPATRTDEVTASATPA